MRPHRFGRPLCAAILATIDRAPSSALIAADAFPGQYAFSPHAAFGHLPVLRIRIGRVVQPVPPCNALACDAARYRPSFLPVCVLPQLRQSCGRCRTRGSVPHLPADLRQYCLDERRRGHVLSQLCSLDREAGRVAGLLPSPEHETPLGEIPLPRKSCSKSAYTGSFEPHRSGTTGASFQPRSRAFSRQALWRRVEAAAARCFPSGQCLPPVSALRS